MHEVRGRIGAGEDWRGVTAEQLGSGWRISAPDTVPFALWPAAGHPDGLPEALWQTVGGWGDRDTTCAIAGGVVAARTGTGGLPADWPAARGAVPAWSGWTPEPPLPRPCSDGSCGY